MANAISRLLQRRSLRRAVRQALDAGVGLYHTSWPVTVDASDAIAGELIAWCREQLVTMHRPYGVDSVSLAVAAVDEQQTPLASASFSVLRPTGFYTGEVEAEARALFARWAGDGVFEPAGARVSAVFFSWGDLTQELVLAS
jgi:hypothetical protein